MKTLHRFSLKLLSSSSKLLLSLIALSAIGLGGLTASAETPEFTMASDVWPPFTDHFGKPRLATELVHIALNQSGVLPITKILDEWTVPADLQADKYDGCGAIWYSEERAQYLLFSKPYLENRLYLVGQKGNNVSATDLSELKGKRIALVKGYAYGDIVDSATGVEFVYGTGDIENLKKLVSDDADYTLVDDLLVQHALNQQPEKCEEFLTIASKPLLKRPLYFVVRKNLPGAAELMEKFNSAIRIMQADGTYNRILRLNSISVDIDGDGKKELVLGDNTAGAVQPTAGYEIYTSEGSETKAKDTGPKRYSIRNQIYDGWDAIPDDFKSEDDFEFETRNEGVNLLKVNF